MEGLFGGSVSVAHHLLKEQLLQVDILALGGGFLCG